jgi:Phage gp6-like head-tail connector protein
MAEMITLAEAKTHLRITDDWHDAEVQAVVTDADATIRGYLDTADDLLWDAVTAPPDVKRATLLLVSHFYEHRGDEDLEENYQKVWATIVTLLRAWRIPTLA